MRELVARGVSPDRLRAYGVGAACPLLRENDDLARVEKRRVEFHIIRQEGSDHETPTPCQVPEEP
jgi:outer membrane protein OmpA-like peptidoglycan-associated protein